MAALEDVLDEHFVRRFLIEQKHTKEELVTEIKARYPNLRAVVYVALKSFVIGTNADCRMQTVFVKFNTSSVSNSFDSPFHSR